ncbi:hypothetical protein OI69_12620 [Pectobacterium fontis]|uniref:Uncharacterized protein n=1 Tax=Pectobacterium fontis TaxID=2558042 RepID=A0A7V8IHR6_9GAMM|nr:hypothetical protein OI69_12620 [Pectobacterium fontis]
MKVLILVFSGRTVIVALSIFCQPTGEFADGLSFPLWCVLYRAIYFNADAGAAAWQAREHALYPP